MAPKNFLIENIRKSKNDETSTLKVFFSNVTTLRNKKLKGRDKAISFLANRPEHVVGTIESHLNGTEANEVCAKFVKAGWVTSLSPAQNLRNQKMELAVEWS